MKIFSMIGLLSAVLFSINAFAVDFNIGLVLDKEGKDDKGFNSAAIKGATMAKDKLGISVKTVETPDDAAFEKALRDLVQDKTDLIFAIGGAQAAAIAKVAKEFPKQKFAIVDAEVKAPNVRSILFEENEGSFLVGAIAALTSKTGTIGFIGGMKGHLIQRFEEGYFAGARKINPKIKGLTEYVGTTSEAWNNPAKAKEIANAEYKRGADVIFAAAGASGKGLFDAAADAGKFAIGVDTNQNWIKPGTILTSMLKRVDIGVFMTCLDATHGGFQGGTKHYGLDTQGVDFSVDANNEKLLPQAVLDRVNQLKVDIIAGKVAVPGKAPGGLR